MKLGAHQVKLDIPTGLALAGYIDRSGVSQGFLDPLYLQALLFHTENFSLGLVIVDLLGVPENLSLAGNGTHLVIPIATHAHSGPNPEAVKEQVENSTRVALAEAQKDLDEVVEVEILRFPVHGVCSRRDILCEEPIETSLIIWKRRAHHPVAFLIFPCHPTVLGPDNLLYSADLAGRLREAVASKVGAFTVYLNSYAGNISTHYTRKSRSYQELDRLTNIFLSQFPSTPGKTVVFCPLQWWETTISLPIATIKQGTPIDDRALPGVRLAAQRRKMGLEKFAHARLCLVRAGEMGFLFTPFELFQETGKCIEKLLRPLFPWPFVIGYALNYRSYVVPKRQKGTYEWFASPYTSEAEPKLLEAVRSLLKSINVDRNTFPKD